MFSGLLFINNKKRSHTQLDSRKQVIAFQDRVITINIKEAQHPLKREKQEKQCNTHVFDIEHSLKRSDFLVRLILVNIKVFLTFHFMFC